MAHKGFIRKALLGSVVMLSAMLAGCRADPPSAQVPPLVRTVVLQPAGQAAYQYTGVVRARTESNLGFRVAGKIAARMVDPGDRVKAGQPLMRLDDTDFKLSTASARSAVESARVQEIRASADEKRLRKLVEPGAVSRQVYDQARAEADAAQAQLRAARADADRTANQAQYATLTADADGVVMQVPAEPGQVVSAGETVVVLARDGQREAQVDLPEGQRDLADLPATARLYAQPDVRFPARLRELSAAADATTRTYRARYTLDAAGAQAPLGATVTLTLNEGPQAGPTLRAPLGAMLDRGNGPGVWVVDPKTNTVAWREVRVGDLDTETFALLSGVAAGERVVALGAHLLNAGQQVRVASAEQAAGLSPRDTPK